jgi:hypothetical protein
MTGEIGRGLTQGPGGCVGYFLRWMVYNPRHNGVERVLIEM